MYKRKYTNAIVEFDGIMNGFKVSVEFIYGHRCGYVYFSTKDCAKYGIYLTDLDVHGGITFSNSEKIGFDCIHQMDAYDVETTLLYKQLFNIKVDKYLNDVIIKNNGENSLNVRSLIYVLNELNNLTKQLRDVVDANNSIKDLEECAKSTHDVKALAFGYTDEAMERINLFDGKVNTKERIVQHNKVFKEVYNLAMGIILKIREDVKK
jgi:hypothetical protein